MHTFTRRKAIILSAKGVAALMAAMPFLTGCNDDLDDGQSNEDPLPDGFFDPEEDASPEPTEDTGGEPDTSTPDASEAPDVPDEPEVINWDEFLSRVALLAEVQFSPQWDQEAYVQDVKEVMEALDLEDDTLQTFYADYVDAVRNFPEITTIHHEDAFELAILEFEAGESIPLHDHPDMTGVIMCVSGEVTIENFTMLPEVSDRGNFLIQRNEVVTMTRGMVGTLTATRGNIHDLRAPVFTQLLDVFTPPYNDDRIRRSRFFSRGDSPLEGTDEIFEATEI